MPHNQIAEYWPTGFIHTSDLAIEHGTLNPKMFGNPSGELGKALERVSISRYHFSLAVFNEYQCTETINFQFKDVLVGIEWFSTA